MHDAIVSPDLEVSPQFQTFLDIFENPKSSTTPPSGIGAEYQTIFGTHTAKWQQGDVTDLPGMLKTVDDEIDAAVKLQAG